MAENKWVFLGWNNPTYRGCFTLLITGRGPPCIFALVSQLEDLKSFLRLIPHPPTAPRARPVRKPQWYVERWWWGRDFWESECFQSRAPNQTTHFKVTACFLKQYSDVWLFWFFQSLQTFRFGRNFPLISKVATTRPGMIEDEITLEDPGMIWYNSCHTCNLFRKVI